MPAPHRTGVEVMRADLRLGDCRAVMAEMAANSVDAIVTDPPYDLPGGFMGKSWDRQGVAFQAGTWQDAYRVLRPGGHLLSFGGTRTFHRLACALEDAGFEIRDTLCWLTGQGFPKSKNLGDGRGSALKPGYEPIIMARKPLMGSLSANVAAHGTGALNIDAARIGTGEGGRYREGEASQDRRYTERGGTNFAPLPGPRGGSPDGRWPANVVLDEAAAALLDEQSGERASSAVLPSGRKTYEHGDNGWSGGWSMQKSSGYGDTGGASRFFLNVPADNEWYACEDCGIVRHIAELTSGCPQCGETMVPYRLPIDDPETLRFKYCPKSSRTERNAGLDGMPERDNVDHNLLASGFRTDPRSPKGGYENKPAPPQANSHPTVKPLALMRWLCRLICPPNGTILDPFLGSGSTGCAAALEGFAFIGIEQDADYLAIAERRIAYWAAHGEDGFKHAKAGPPRPSEMYGNGRGYLYTVPRCPEHGATFPSGSTTYRCGCKAVRRPTSEDPRRSKTEECCRTQQLELAAD